MHCPYNSERNNVLYCDVYKPSAVRAWCLRRWDLTFNLRVKVINDDLQLRNVHSLQQLTTELTHFTVHEAGDSYHLAPPQHTLQLSLIIITIITTIVSPQAAINLYLKVKGQGRFDRPTEQTKAHYHVKLHKNLSSAARFRRWWVPCHLA